MADWDADSPQLHDNLAQLLRRIRQEARRRDSPTVEDARRWHSEVMRNLQVPNPKFVGAFRGEAGLEDIQVLIASRYGLPPFLRLRARPAGACGIASQRAMLGGRSPTVALFRELLANFAIDANRD